MASESSVPNPSSLTPSFLGFDFSTQQIKCVCTDFNLKVLKSYHVTFDSDLPQYGTNGGVCSCVDHKTGKERVFAPTKLWIEAVDLLFEKMKLNGVDFSQVRGLSGCGQMHGTIYWKDNCDSILANLNSKLPLHKQMTDCFAVDNSPVWVDSSTSEECHEMESAIGGPEAMAEISGSKAYERFCGPQIRYMYKNYADVYQNTKRISIVSSFSCSLFVGKVAPIDYGDASGTNLVDIKSFEWSHPLISCCAPDLEAKLGKPVASYTNIGTISNYWTERYGFPVDCAIAAFTGDNCASVEGLRAKTGDLVISCGTSDNLIFLGTDLKPSIYGHLFASPLKSQPYFFNLCYKNGSLVRENFKNEHCSSDWSRFEDLLNSTPVGNNGFIGLFYPKPEHIPQNSQGVFLFGPDGEKLDSMEPKYQLRALVEGQFLMKRVHLKNLAGFSQINNRPRILITGGASRNQALCQIIANVYNGHVYYLDIPNAAALGNAYRAKFCLDANQHYESIFDTKDDESLKLVASPQKSAVDIYNSMLSRFEIIERDLFSFQV